MLDGKNFQITKTAKENPLRKYFFPGGFAAMLFCVPISHNLFHRRPLYSGIQRHILLGLLGFALGTYVDRYFDKKFMERDAIIRHYIELHPEDFTEEKKKYREIMEEWYPIR